MTKALRESVEKINLLETQLHEEKEKNQQLATDLALRDNKVNSL
jgi:hypothetical protein